MTGRMRKVVPTTSTKARFQKPCNSQDEALCISDKWYERRYL